jgi:hypothetical protein
MVALELVDAIPEAAIVADAAVAGTLTWTFVVSIFCLNLANTFATAIDFTATRSSRALHRLLYCSIFFSVGMLMYSINTTVYGSFRIAYSKGTRDWSHALFLVFGTFIGALLIVVLMKFEEKAHHHATEDRSSDPMFMLEVNAAHAHTMSCCWIEMSEFTDLQTCLVRRCNIFFAFCVVCSMFVVDCSRALDRASRNTFSTKSRFWLLWTSRRVRI